MELNSIQKNILYEVAELEGFPKGAYNIRANGQLAGRQNSANIEITTKTDKPGIDINIKPNTKNADCFIKNAYGLAAFDIYAVTLDDEKTIINPNMNKIIVTINKGLSKFLIIFLI